MPRRLILIRHSTPHVQRDVPARDWRLSEEGVARARAFAGRLDPGGAAAIYSSAEPKALETAQALGDVWGLPVEEAAGLHEHERPDVPIMTREDFEAQVRAMFERPTEQVFGAETAEAARLRFSRAVLRLLQKVPDDVVVITHGTVMALFVAACTGADAFTLWKRQQMPFAIALSVPELALERVTLPD